MDASSFTAMELTLNEKLEALEKDAAIIRQRFEDYLEYINNNNN